MEGINSDKVNINLGEGRSGGDGGAGIAAIIAALGNRNQGNDNAALIAALGNRNDSASQLGPLLAMMGNRRDDNDGMNSMWPLLLLLLGRGRGGLGGGDDCSATAAVAGLSPAQAAMLQTLLEGQSALRAEVPTTALETQNAIQSAISSLALGTQQGFANTGDKIQNGLLAQLTASAGVKDAVQNSFAILNQNILDQGCKGREATQASTTAILSRIDRAEIDELRHDRDRFERQVEVNSLRAQVEITNTNTATATQAQGQAQFQVQLQDLNNRIARVFDRLDVVHQEQRSTNANIIAGNTGAVTTGAQTSTPTNVNARG